MAIVNRDKDISEQKEVLYFDSGATISAGVSLLVRVIPYPCQLINLSFASQAAGTSLQVMPIVLRSTSAGMTAFAMGASYLFLNTFASVGAQGFSSLTQGSTLVQLQKGDVLGLDFAGANGVAAKVVANMVIQKLQDIVSYNGAAN